MGKILTTDEALGELSKEYPAIAASFKGVLIAFAKMHVVEAVATILKKAEVSGQWGGEHWSGDRLQTRDSDGNWVDVGVSPTSISTAYPLENII